jgi:uncharacterized repeat protein (TIGR01451 family)
MLRSLLLGIGFPALLVPASAIQVGGYVDHPACGVNDGVIITYVNGGQAPFTFVWDDGPATQDRIGLGPGVYTVTVTDDLGDTDSETFTLYDEGLQFISQPITYMGGFECPGMANGHFSVTPEFLPGIPPHTFEVTVNGSPLAQGADLNGLPTWYGLSSGDDIWVTVTDDTGCQGAFNFLMHGPTGALTTISDIQPACGEMGGSIMVYPPSFDWPVDLTIIDADFNVVYSGLAEVAEHVIDDLAPGDYTMIQGWTQYMVDCTSTVEIPFTVPDLGPDCGTVNGRMWYDVNSNCDLDNGEVAIPFSTLLVQPGDHYLITNAAGLFNYRIVNGNYLLYENDPELILNCPQQEPVPFAMDNNTITIDLPNSSTEPLDIAVYAGDGIPRPGFDYSVWATVRNVSPQTSGPITVSITFDASLTYVDASPEPLSVVGNVIMWDLAAFGSFGEASVSAVLAVPVGTPLGTILSTTATASQPLAEIVLVNNTSIATAEVIGSFDPNNKTALTSSRVSATQYFMEGDLFIDYTIRFQNTGTDTAFTVVIQDTIAPELDMASFEQGTASHAFEISFRPGRVVEWRFDNINLPDSGTNELESHGLVTFRIKPTQPLVAGTLIANNADIYFDANEPVITDEVVLVVEMGTGAEEPEREAGALQLFPNPASTTVWLSAPGMRSIEVYAADGRLVGVEHVHSDQVQLPVGSLPRGSYNVNVRLADGSVLRDRFIKY